MTSAWMIVPASPERFDGVRDFSSHLAGALSASLPVETFTTTEDLAPRRGTAVLQSWRELESRPLPARAVLVNYAPQAWLRRDARALLAVLGKARRAGARVVLIVHEYQLDPAPSIARIGGRALFRLLGRSFAARADFLVATHGFVADWARRDGLGRHTRIVTIPVGSNLPEPRANAPVPGNVRVTMFGQPAGMSPPAVAHVARLLASKSVELSWLCRSEAEVTSWLRANNVMAPHVRLLPRLDEEAASRELSASAIGFAPIVDGVSTRRTTVAAMLQHGLPIVGADGRATDPVLRDSGAFALAAIHDGAGLSNRMTSVLEDSSKRSEMSIAARRLYEAHLSWTRVAGEYLRLLD